jgi:hypothetical protein
MTKAKYVDETEAVASRIKRGLDERILEEYVLTFRDSRKDRDGCPIPEDVVWSNLTEMLCIDGTTRWRFVKGVDRTGNRPLSPFDGRPERYRPGIEEVFRYIAAVDLTLEAIQFPRGRVIVNRAMARALTGLRRITTGEDYRISEVELERLRFLERWNRLHVTRSGFSVQTVRDMFNENRENLLGDIEFSDQFIRSLNRLFADWTLHHARLLNNLPYDWLRG